MTIKQRIAIAAATVAGLGATASAVPMVPGQFVSPLPGTTSAAEPQLAGTVVQDVTRTLTGNFSNSGLPYEVRVQDRVVRAIDGTYDFYHQFTLVEKPTSYPLTVRRDGMGGYATNVGWRTDGDGTAAPGNATRTGGAGDAVSFDFGLGLPEGTTTRFVFVDTNAPSYALNATGRVDLSAAVGETAYADFATFGPAVPEPTTLAGLGAILLAAGRRRR